MARRVKLSTIFPERAWADAVVGDLDEKEARKLVNWWKGKDAKAIWGTERAAKKREALRESIANKYGDT